MKAVKGTLSPDEHEAVVRGLLESLSARMRTADAEIERLLAPGASPNDPTGSYDTARFLMWVEQGIHALRTVGWPIPERP